MNEYLIVGVIALIVIGVSAYGIKRYKRKQNEATRITKDSDKR